MNIMKKKLFLCSTLALCLFGINTTVKADGYVVDSAPDSFVTNVAGRGYENGQLTKTENDAVLANQSISAAGQNVIDYHTSDNKKVFCINRLISYNPDGGVTYTKTDEKVDYGIVYIITHYLEYLPNAGNGADYSTAVSRPYEQSWLTQIAIWKYNAQKDDSDNFENITVNTEDIHEGGPDALTGSDYYYYSKNATTLWSTADKLVAAAKTAVDPDSVTSLTVNYDGNHTIDKDNKIIKTNIISVDMTNITSYSIDLSKASDGVKVYAEDGSEIADANNITVDKFYLAIPIDNVDNYTYDFDITLTSGDYTYYKGKRKTRNQSLFENYVC